MRVHGGVLLLYFNSHISAQHWVLAALMSFFASGWTELQLLAQHYVICVFAEFPIRDVKHGPVGHEWLHSDESSDVGHNTLHISHR